MSDEGMSDAALAKLRRRTYGDDGYAVDAIDVRALIARLDAITATLAESTAERDRLYSLAKANNNLARMMTTERKALREAASKAADQFGFYVTEHRAKGTPASYTKVETNERMRDMLLAALTANHSAPVVEE